MTPLIDEVRHDDSTTLAQLTVEQYHRMNEVGILPDGAPVELIDGVPILKDRRDANGDPITHGPGHASLIQSIRDAIEPLVRSRDFHVRTQSPVTIPPDSEPEPDLAVVRGSIREYVDQYPGPNDVALIVEIAFSSLSRDRKIKTRLYAAAGVPEHWIVNVQSQRVEVYREPVVNEGRYGAVTDHGVDETISFHLNETTPVEIAVSDFLF